MKKIRSRFSSFWLWFVVAFLVNQIILFLAVLFLMSRPMANLMAQVVGSAINSAVALQQVSQAKDFELLAHTYAPFKDIFIRTAPPEPTRVLPSTLPGLHFLKNALEEKVPGDIRISYTNLTEPIVWVEHLSSPRLSIGYSFKSRFFVVEFLTLALFLVIVISSVAAYWISTRLTRPLKALSDAAMRLGKEKDFSQIQLPTSSSPEIAQLAKTLNEMRTMLDASITDREKFLAGIAHDLRTPLSRMRMALVLEQSNNEALNAELQDDIVEMSAIVDQFVELSRLNTELDEPTIQGSLNALVEQVAAKYQRAGFNITLDLHPALANIDMKPLAMRRLLYNLIENAHRHGADDAISIRTYEQSRQTVLSVSNAVSNEAGETGLVRALRLQQQSGGSAGLGLALVRKFAQVHHARFTEVVEHPMRYSTLTFESPSKSP